MLPRWRARGRMTHAKYIDDGRGSVRRLRDASAAANHHNPPPPHRPTTNAAPGQPRSSNTREARRAAHSCRNRSVAWRGAARPMGGARRIFSMRNRSFGGGGGRLAATATRPCQSTVGSCQLESSTRLAPSFSFSLSSWSSLASRPSISNGTSRRVVSCRASCVVCRARARLTRRSPVSTRASRFRRPVAHPTEARSPQATVAVAVAFAAQTSDR